MYSYIHTYYYADVLQLVGIGYSHYIFDTEEVMLTQKESVSDCMYMC